MEMIDELYSRGAQQRLVEKLKNVPKVRLGEYVFHFDPNFINDEYRDRARTELRETPEVVADALKTIKALAQEECDLVIPDDDDGFYVRYLRPCKWHTKPAFELMRRWFRFRLKYARICDNLTPSKEKVVLTSGLLMPLPNRGIDGCRLLIVEGGKKWNPKEVSLEQLFKGMMLYLQGGMNEQSTQIAGARVIFDMAGLSLGQVTYFTPSFANMAAEWVQRCLPLRLKGIHIVNQPFLFNMVFAVFRPFLQEKLRKRIHFHGTDMAALASFIGKNNLPTKFGGPIKLPDDPVGDVFWKYMCAFEEDFEDANSYGYVKHAQVNK